MMQNKQNKQGKNDRLQKLERKPFGRQKGETEEIGKEIEELGEKPERTNGQRKPQYFKVPNIHHPKPSQN